MAKQHKLTSPYGEVALTPSVDYVHIEASSPLAGDWGLGWWHATNSGDEVVFSRAFWRGELASGHRPTPAQAEVDAFIAPWGFSTDLDLETSRLPAGQRSRVQAYAQGFNQGRHRRSGESPWAPEDSHLLARTLGFLEWWETRLPQRNFLLQAWQAGLAWSQLADLWPGLGEEPSPVPWQGWVPPPPFSPEARALVDKIRRFRPGQAWTIPASQTQGGRALLGAQFVSDVTDPGLPLVAARVESPDGVVWGLGRPGHPGFLAGQTDRLAWHVTPAVDDTIDLRLRDNDWAKPLSGRWAGAGKTGTLGALLDMETATTADGAREQTAHLGSAALDWVAVDAEGQTSRWAQGPRWLRPHPREAWLPTGQGDLRTGPRTTTSAEWGTSRVTPALLEERLTTKNSPFVEQALAPLRFLLPDTEEGQRLRRWTGTPGPEAALFERLYSWVLDTFWASSPLVPDAQSPVSQALAPVIDRLILAAHSEWLPSRDKNHRLAEAVRKAFAPGQPAAPSLLARRAALPRWTEVDGNHRRVFAATVVVLAEPGAPHWKVFLTDDETETPTLRRW